MTIKISLEINEAKNGNELDDQETPIVYPNAFKIICDDSEKEVEEDMEVTLENDSITMILALNSIGATGFLNVNEEVYSLMNSENPYLQWAATQVLGQVADCKALELLIKALDSEVFDVRWGAVTAMAEIAKKWIIFHLVRSFNNDRDHHRDCILRAFQELWGVEQITDGDAEVTGETQ